MFVKLRAGARFNIKITKKPLRLLGYKDYVSVVCQVSNAINGDLNGVRFVKIPPIINRAFNQFAIAQLDNCPTESLCGIKADFAVANLTCSKSQAQGDNQGNNSNFLHLFTFLVFKCLLHLLYIVYHIVCELSS